MTEVTTPHRRDADSGLAVCMRAAEDAVALVRAYLANDGEAASRLLADTQTPSALAANLAFMVKVAAATLLPEPLLEQYLSFTLRAMQDNTLDLDFAQLPPWPPGQAA